MGVCCDTPSQDHASAASRQQKPRQFPAPAKVPVPQKKVKQVIEAPKAPVRIVEEPLDESCQFRVDNVKHIARKLAEVTAIVKLGQEWTDNEFPPEASSLYSENGKELEDSTREFYDSLEWRRPKEIWPEGYELFSGGIDPCDINQGQLGNCYFLATISALAERPDEVKWMFETKKANEAGIYLIYFYVNGIKTPVIVDDWIPCRDTSPAFCSTNQPELWAILLEKAWAKLHSNYHDTEGGLGYFASSNMNGVPSYNLNHAFTAESATDEEKEETYRVLKDADRRGYTMMSSSAGLGEEQSEMGVVSGHAYSLISIHEFEHEGEEVKLMKLRNPWGSYEWKGDWSDSSELWTEELREEIGCEETNDGIFHMTFNDFLDQFKRTSICAVVDNTQYKHNTLVCDFGQPNVAEEEFSEPQFVEFTIEQDIPLKEETFAVIASQQGPRLSMYRKREDAEKYNDARISIVLFSVDEQRIVNWYKSYERFFPNILLDQEEDVELKAGKYVVMLDSPWNEQTQNHADFFKIACTVFCKQLVKMNTISTEKAISQIAPCIKEYAFEKYQDKKGYNQEDFGMERIRGVYEFGNWMGFNVVNNAGETNVEYSMKFVNLDLMHIVGKELNEEKEFSETLAPGEFSVYLIKRYGAKCSYRAAWSSRQVE